MVQCAVPRTSSGSSLPAYNLLPLSSPTTSYCIPDEAAQRRACHRTGPLPRLASTYWAATQSHCHFLSLSLWETGNYTSGFWLLATSRRTRVPTAACEHAGICQLHIRIRSRCHRCPLSLGPQICPSQVPYFQLEAGNKFCTSIKNANDRRYVDRFINAHKSYCSA
jgi:hypothetical protein